MAAVLSAFLLLAAACGSGKGPASLTGDVPLPSPGDVPGLTAQRIADLSVEAIEPFVTVRAEGRFLSYGTGEDVQSATFVSEWTAPDRARQIGTQRTPDGTNISEIIMIGDRMYQRPGFGTDDWQEFQSEGDGARSMPIELISEVRFEEPAEVVEWNGTTVYRITGRQKEQETGEGNAPRDLSLSLNHSDVVFIDISSFLILRHERTINSESTTEIAEASAPGGRRSKTEVLTVEVWFEFTYHDEPLVILPPDEYVPARNSGWTGDDSPPHTPTPFAGFPTPTPSPVRALPRRGGAIPVPIAVAPTVIPAPWPGPTRQSVIGAPLSSPELPPVPVSFDHVPVHNRLDLGDITVVYTPCDPGSVIDGPPILIVHTPTGSAAFQSLESAGGSVRYGSTFEYKASSQTGAEAMENVLGNPGLMEMILERSPRPARCSSEFAGLLRTYLFDLPESSRHTVDNDTVARFEFCETIAKHLVAPVVVTHIPTESIVGIRPGESTHKIVSFGTPSGHRHLERVLADSSLVTELLALAPREARCQ